MKILKAPLWVSIWRLHNFVRLTIDLSDIFLYMHTLNYTIKLIPGFVLTFSNTTDPRPAYPPKSSAITPVVWCSSCCSAVLFSCLSVDCWSFFVVLFDFFSMVYKFIFTYGFKCSFDIFSLSLNESDKVIPCTSSRTWHWLWLLSPITNILKCLIYKDLKTEKGNG